ncbi:hypothetical protein ACIBG8_02595 [Nonomuraea sp. NPDC050556]|uniref:hypothetical protein n=1 Tax=Nonomuraea sp. NPDC050556 TaxID=3364369 RepID=UPI0037BCC5EB
MREPNPTMGYGLGLFVQDLGPGCGTVYQHNGSPPHGYGTLMYSSPDGTKTLTASVTWIDDATRGPGQGLPEAHRHPRQAGVLLTRGSPGRMTEGAHHDRRYGRHGKGRLVPEGVRAVAAFR